MSETEQPRSDVTDEMSPITEQLSRTRVGSGEDYESAEENSSPSDMKTVQKESDEAAQVMKVDENGLKDEIPAGTEEDETASNASSKDSENVNVGRRRRSEGSNENDSEDVVELNRERKEDDNFAAEDVEARNSKIIDEDQFDEEQDDAISPKKPEEEPEDRTNPAFVPRRGNFYEHDNREREEPEKSSGRQSKKQIMMEKQNRWHHDMYDEREQTPKSRQELINIYGYDIRNETKAPRDPRGRHYGRNQNFRKDTRNSETVGRRPFGGHHGGEGRRANQNDYRQGQNLHTMTAPPEFEAVDTRRKNQREIVEEEQSNYRSRNDYAGSRSYLDAEYGYEQPAARNTYRDGDGGGQRRQVYGTVEYRRRGRGTAFTTSPRYSNAAGQKNYDAAYQKHPRQENQHSDRPLNHTRGRGDQYTVVSSQRDQSSNASNFQREREETEIPSPETATLSAFQREETSNQGRVQQRSSPIDASRQQTKNQSGSVLTKRYSAIRQQQVQPNAGSTFPVPSEKAATLQDVTTAPVNLQQGHAIGQVAMPMMVQSMDHPPLYQAPIPYFNGSGMYHQGAPVSGQDVYQVQVPFPDGAHSYVLPPANYIGQQQQYLPAAYQTINAPQLAHYAAETAETYAATGGSPVNASGAVYFDPNSQQPRTHTYAATDVPRRQPKVIQIVSPNQAQHLSGQDG